MLKLKTSSRFSKTLFFYVSFEFLLSFLVCFALVFVALFINQVIVQIQELLDRNISMYNSLHLVILASPVFFAMGFPFASLLASLLTMGRLSGDNELVAFETLGFSFIRYFFPFIFWSLFLTAATFFTHNYLMPLGLQQFREKLYRISQESPEVIFKEYSISEIGESLLIVSDVDELGANGVLIIDTAETGETRVISSKKAQLLQGQENSSHISIGLDDPFVLTPTDYQDYLYIRSDKLQYNMLFNAINKSIVRTNDVERSVFEIQQSIGQLNLDTYIRKLGFNYDKSLAKLRYLDDLERKYNGIPINDATIDNVYSEVGMMVFDEKSRRMQNYVYSFWAKIYGPFMCTVFVIFGFSTGIFFRRSGRGANLGIGVLASVFYFFVDEVLKSFVSDNLEYDANLFAALPIAFFLFLGIFLLYLRIKR